MRIWVWALWAPVPAALAAWLVYWVRQRLTFFPSKRIETTPADAGLSFEEVRFTARDGVRLHGWFVKASGPFAPVAGRRSSSPVLLFCHGNAGNIGHRIEKMNAFAQLGLDALYFDYRGYGKSAGRPGEKGFYRDALAAYHYLVHERLRAPSSIILYGESIGGAVAANLAAYPGAAGLILESSFPEIFDVARAIYPWFVSIFAGGGFDTAASAAKARCPKLLFHSVDDEVVPFRLGEALFHRALGPKEFIRLRGSHNTAFFDSFAAWSAGIRGFLTKVDGGQNMAKNDLKVKVERLDSPELSELGVFQWPIWEKEKSAFDWHYDERERCYFLEGRVSVETDAGEVSFGKGDFVTFPQGLSCVWTVHEPVKKHYKFG